MASDFTLRHARYFLAAVEEGTMAAAGRRLHVSPSAVSLAVADLEEIVDAPLLLRVPHKPLALTATGASIVADLRRLTIAAEDLVTNARDQAHQLAGHLKVGCYLTIAPTHIPALVAATNKQYPAIDLQFEELTLDGLQVALLDGHLELGLLYDLDIGPEIATETLTLTKPYILLGEDHRLADRKAVRLRELENDPMVMLDVPPSKHYFSSMLKTVGVEPPIERTTGSTETLRSLVARNQGWSMLITRPTINLTYEGLSLRSVEIADDLEPMPIVAAWPANTRLTRRATAFLELSHETIGSRRHR